MPSQQAIMTYLLSKLELCILYDYLIVFSFFFVLNRQRLFVFPNFITCFPLDARKDGGRRERGLDY